MTFLYFRYLDKFHTEPYDLGQLFEFNAFLNTSAKINKLIADSMPKE